VSAVLKSGRWTVEEHELSEGFSAVVYDGNGVMIADHLSLDRAHLIAAAPRLYSALEDCVRRLRTCAKLHGNSDWTIDALCEPSEQALAKARGEQP
jgi:hypothetical protein